MLRVGPRRGRERVTVRGSRELADWGYIFTNCLLDRLRTQCGGTQEVPPIYSGIIDIDSRYDGYFIFLTCFLLLRERDGGVHTASVEERW